MNTGDEATAATESPVALTNETGREPPPWGDDSLSELLTAADRNARVTAAKYPNIFELLRRVDKAFRRAEEIVVHDSAWVRVVPRFLLVRTHATFVAAIRTGLSGQVSEACVLLRAAVEQSWYALHMAMEPKGDTRVEIWLRRNEGERAKNKCRGEFTVAKVRSTHEKLDPTTASHIHKIYEKLIDYGAHPNQMGVLSALTQKKSSTQIDYSVGLIYPTEPAVMATLQMAVGVAVGSLKIFRLIYPERFELASLDGEIEALVVELNSRFTRFSSRRRSASKGQAP